MKHFGRLALALLLAASMVCGMLIPAFAWIPEQTYLRSPDGVYWFDMTEVNYWPSECEFDSRMIYSQDGIVWFSEEGLQYYKHLLYGPDETWQEHFLDSSVDGSSFYTTDFGKMWIRFENGVIDYSDWTDWLDVWPPETINLDDASQHLYRNDESFVMCTEPLNDNSHRIGVLEAGFSKLGKYVSEVRFNVAPSDADDHLLLSTDGETWAASIPESAWTNTDNYVKNLLGAGICFNPYTGVAYQYAATYNGQFTLRRVADAGDCPALVQRTLYLRADSDCSVSLELTCDNTAHCTYGMMSLQSIPAEDREISQNTPLAGLPERAGAMLIVGEAEDALRSYTPIDIPAGTTVSFTDANNNYVFDPADECSGSLTLEPYTVQAQSSGEATVQLHAGCTYSIPFWFWMEGQDADAVPDSGAFHNTDALFNLQIRYEEEPEHVHTYGEPEWNWADNFSAATATFTCDTCGEEAVCDASLEVIVIEKADCTTDQIATCTATVNFDGATYNSTVREITIPDTALGHAFGEWVVTTPATVEADGAETRTCTRCGDTETRAVEKLPAPAKFSVIGGRARPGETVQVSVDLSGNPGIVAAMLHLTYDPQILTLTAVDNGDVFGTDSFQPGGDIAAVPYTMFWQDALALEDNTANGTLVTFTFAVAGDAPLGITPVTVTYEQESTFDQQLQDAEFAVDNGSVTVFDRMPGDADGDGALDLQDVAILCRYLAGGWSVDADVRNSDVDGDGKLTLKDVVLLRRYLAGGWGVVLK